MRAGSRRDSPRVSLARVAVLSPTPPPRRRAREGCASTDRSPLRARQVNNTMPLPPTCGSPGTRETRLPATATKSRRPIARRASSSCSLRNGRWRLYEGEGLIGLAPLSSRGARRTVVATQWRRSTRRPTDGTFTGGSPPASTPDAALRDAQLAFAEKAPHEHPSYWGSGSCSSGRSRTLRLNHLTTLSCWSARTQRRRLAHRDALSASSRRRRSNTLSFPPAISADRCSHRCLAT